MSYQFLGGLVIGLVIYHELVPYLQQILQSLPQHEVASRRVADLLALKDVAVMLLMPGGPVGPGRDCLMALLFLGRLLLGFSAGFVLNSMAAKAVSQWVRALLNLWAPGAVLDSDARRSNAATHSRLLGALVVTCIVGGAVAALSVFRTSPRVEAGSLPGTCAVAPPPTIEGDEGKGKFKTRLKGRRGRVEEEPADVGACAYGVVDQAADRLAGGLSGGLASLHELHGEEDSAVLRLLTQLAVAAVAYNAISYGWLFYGGGMNLLEGDGEASPSDFAGRFRGVAYRALRLAFIYPLLIGGRYTKDLM